MKHVLGGSTETEITASVIEFVAIDVIDLQMSRSVEEEPMKLNARTGTTQGTPSVEPGMRPGSMPHQMANEMLIRRVDNGGHPLRQLDCRRSVTHSNRQSIRLDREVMTMPALRNSGKVRPSIVETVPVEMTNDVPLWDISKDEPMKVNVPFLPVNPLVPQRIKAALVANGTPRKLRDALGVFLVDQCNLVLGKGNAYSSHVGQLLTVDRPRLGLSLAAPGLYRSSIIPVFPVSMGF